MELKEFQEICLEKLDYYLKTLKEIFLEEKKEIKLHKTQGKTNKFNRYCRDTWEKLQKEGRLPKAKDQREKLQIPPYQNKKDGLGNSIPNICLKVPTGGGKTLLGVSAVERINFDFFRQNTGLILWIVPTKAIYNQTLKSFKDKTHFYRDVIERAGAKKVKILEKTDPFSKQDLQEYLCVMLLMLQASNREDKKFLKMFKDSGTFISFFPKQENHLANEKLISEIKNLETHTAENALGGSTGISIKHSLGNAIRIARPIVVMDEGHKAYSMEARSTITDLNPRFILELSATPNMKEHLSNILVNVSGIKLKEEDMIKLPINVHNTEKGDWKKTLCQSYDKLKQLEKDCQIYQEESKSYIRPIMLIQVERTGKDQKDSKFIHSQDAKEYLIKHLGVNEEAIKIKTSQQDELKGENLLSDTSPVQFIITKQALQEGWDCPFVYILAVLSKAKSKLALTQLIGRILRQPYAKKTSIDSLNESYIYCCNKKVSEVVSQIRKGLQKEGMDDLEAQVITEDSSLTKKVISKRNPKFKDTKIFLPRVLCKDNDGSWRKVSYAHDILQEIDFSKISYSKKDNWTPENIDSLKTVSTKMDIDEEGSFMASKKQIRNEGVLNLDYPFMVRRVCNFIPNPWDASRILDEVLSSLRDNNVPDEKIYLNRDDLIGDIENDVRSQMDNMSEKVFENKLKNGSFCFKIFKKNININWSMGFEMNFMVSKSDRKQRKKDDDDFQTSLFDLTYESQYNELERQVAYYLDEKEAVKWWHRLIAKQDYHLQGWQKAKVYPDFLALITPENQVRKLSVLETKGEHLKGNEDTEYKKKLFSLLEKHASDETVSVGDMEVVSEKEQKMVFKILMAKNWKEDLGKLTQTKQK